MARKLKARDAAGAVAFLGSGNLTTEEAYLLAAVADWVGSPHRSVVWARGRRGPSPTPAAASPAARPLRTAVAPSSPAWCAAEGAIDAAALLEDDGAADCALLIVADSDFGPGAHDPEVVARLRKAQFLVVLGWADTPLSRAADVALPTATHAEKDGTFVNVERRLQRLPRRLPAAGPGAAGGRGAAPTSSAGSSRPGPTSTRQAPSPGWPSDRAVFKGLALETLPATGVPLAGPARPPRR